MEFAKAPQTNTNDNGGGSSVGRSVQDLTSLVQQLERTRTNLDFEKQALNFQCQRLDRVIQDLKMALETQLLSERRGKPHSRPPSQPPTHPISQPPTQPPTRPPHPPAITSQSTSGSTQSSHMHSNGNVSTRDTVSPPVDARENGWESQSCSSSTSGARRSHNSGNGDEENVYFGNAERKIFGLGRAGVVAPLPQLVPPSSPPPPNTNDTGTPSLGSSLLASLPMSNEPVAPTAPPPRFLPFATGASSSSSAFLKPFMPPLSSLPHHHKRRHSNLGFSSKDESIHQPNGAFVKTEIHPPTEPLPKKVKVTKAKVSKPKSTTFATPVPESELVGIDPKSIPLKNEAIHRWMAQDKEKLYSADDICAAKLMYRAKKDYDHLHIRAGRIYYFSRRDVKNCIGNNLFKLWDFVKCKCGDESCGMRNPRRCGRLVRYRSTPVTQRIIKNPTNFYSRATRNYPQNNIEAGRIYYMNRLQIRNTMKHGKGSLWNFVKCACGTKGCQMHSRRECGMIVQYNHTQKFDK